MKIVYAAAAVLLISGFTSCTPSKEKLKEQFVKSCMGEVEGKVDPSMKQSMQEYCECSGEKVVNKFSASEMAAFGTMDKDKLQAKLMPVIQGCLNELQAKIEAQQQAQGATPAQ